MSSVELVRACLDRIDSFDPALNAFITVTREAALTVAAERDAQRRAGRSRGPLHGIPISIKDNIDTAGVRTTAASAVYDERVPDIDAEVVRRLVEAGVVVIGKTNMGEFAAAGTSATSYFGPVRNPWALERDAGGSSGGSAVAAIAGFCYGSVGTDTGGSIRTPSAACSVVGLKPTYGLVPVRGIIPTELSLDHCGPIARTTTDVALLLNAIAGHDPLDHTSVEHPLEDYVAEMRRPIRGLRIGIPRTPFFDALDPEVARVAEDALRTIERLVASVRETMLPPTRDIDMALEMFAWHEELFARHPDRLQPATRLVLERASTTKAAEYARSRWRMEVLRRTIDRSFADVDLVVLPTRKRVPRTIESAQQHAVASTPRDRERENTRAFNVYGIPAISVPAGFTQTGLPVGLSIAGPRFSDGKVLALANAFERATDFHLRRPPLQQVPRDPLGARA